MKIKFHRVENINELDKFCIDPLIRDDIIGIISDRKNFVIIGEYAVVVFIERRQAIFEVFVECLVSGRGKWASEARYSAMEWIFTNTDALEVFARIPRTNVAAITMARMIGFEREFIIKDAFVNSNKFTDAIVYSLSFQRWVRTDPRLIDIGKFINEVIEKEAKLLDRELYIINDEAFYRNVALAVILIQNNRCEKAIVFYNRYASIAGLSELACLSIHPLTMIMGCVRIIFDDNGYGVSLI